MKIYNPKLDNGFLFNQFQGLMLRALNLVESDSDLLVKVAQKIKRDKNITHDHQIFRDFRANELDVERLQSYLGFELPEGYPDYNSCDTKSIGGWLHLQGAVFMLRNASGESDCLDTFWSFISAHCQLEYEQILLARTTKDISLAEEFLQQWLYLDEISLTSHDPSSIITYVINMIMFWSACFELFLELEYQSDDHSIMCHLLPTWHIKKEEPYFSNTNERVIEQVKRNWAKKTYNRDSISNAQLHRDILSKQYDDETLDTSQLFTCKEDIIDPNTDAIKKRFQRIGKGQLFTLKQFRTDIAILNLSFKDTEDELALIIPYLLTNLFTLCQTDLIKMGCKFDLIVDNFSYYPEMKLKIKKRYEHFQDSGELNP